MAAIDELMSLLARYRELEIDSQIDYGKFYLYSIITHSTAIEGSTVTEFENQMLFDEGITAKGKTIAEQMMNLDLKAAYEESIRQAKNRAEITVDLLKAFARLVMKNTGSVYKTAIGEFSSAEGDLRLLNVTAGAGGRSYLSYAKVPAKLEEFCRWLNAQRAKEMTAAQRYNLSFDAHYRLVTIHPWADGNGRMARLLMNHIQFEFGLVSSKILKEDKAEYISALNATRESEDLDCFREFMAKEMVRTIGDEIASFVRTLQDSGENAVSGGYKVKSREKVVRLLRDNPRMTTRQLADSIGVSDKAIEKHLARLKSDGLLVREGSDRSGRWIVLYDLKQR